MKTSKSVLWIPTHIWFDFKKTRVLAIETAIFRLTQKDPDNKGVITGLLMHMLRNIDSTALEIPTHIRDSLADIQNRSLVSTFGMMFLHDLDFRRNRETLINVAPIDTPDILRQLGVGPRKHKRALRQGGEPPSIEYPFGTSPTWKQVRDIVAKEPLTIIRHWSFPSTIVHISTVAGTLFTLFTKQIWLLLNKEQLTAELEIESLEDAMSIWSAQSVFHALYDAKFTPHRNGLVGAVPGGKTQSFREMAKIYFPRPGPTPTTRSQWYTFHFLPQGYINKYHQSIKDLDMLEEDNLNESLYEIFQFLQCLPVSIPYSPGKPGVVWSRIPAINKIPILCNSKYLRLTSVGQVATVRRTPTQGTRITKSQELMTMAILESVDAHEEMINRAVKYKRKTWHKEMKKRSGKHKNRRAPPKKKVMEEKHVFRGSSSDSSEGGDEEERFVSEDERRSDSDERRSDSDERVSDSDDSDDEGDNY